MVKPSKILVLSAVAALVSGPVIAQSGPEVGAIAGSLREQGSDISALIGVAAFVAGVVMACAGLMKFWTMAKNPNDPSAKMSTAFILMFVGGALAALPTSWGLGSTRCSEMKAAVRSLRTRPVASSRLTKLVREGKIFMKFKNIYSFVILSLLMSSAAFAQSAPQAGAIAGSLRQQGSQISALIGAAAFVAGVGLAFAGLMNFWTMAKNPNGPSAKMSTAFILMFVGGALAALLTVMGSRINMLLRNNNEKPQLTNATSLRSIAT